jgi:class 3 adenylate cyclase
VVNLASSAQSLTKAGQILAIQAVYESVLVDMAEARPGTYVIKGLDKPVVLYTA